jgi:predicted transcriptional regulator
MKNAEIKPTDSELQILQVLWDKGPSSVRDVNEILNETKETGYTTTLKLMQIMTEKGLVSRDTSQRTHIYIPTVAREATQSTLLQSFLKTTFQGSAKALVLQALGNNTASEEELQEIKDLIDKLQNQ